MLRIINRVPQNFDELYREMDSVVQQLFGDEKVPQGFSPRTNVAETASAFEVSVELPGVRPEEVHVGVEEGYLVVSGDHKNEPEQVGKTFHRVERRYGTFRRTIRVPENVVEDQIEAAYRDGVLTIVLPKADKEKPRKIEIKTS